MPGLQTGANSQRALDENVETIKAWERASLSARSRAEQIGDWIARTAASGAVLVAHVLWFGLWVIANEGWIPGVVPFDPFPFSLLTVTAALEAIFLTLVVLASQNRLSRQSEIGEAQPPHAASRSARGA